MKERKEKEKVDWTQVDLRSLFGVQDDQGDAGHAGDKTQHDQHGHRPDLHVLLTVRVLKVLFAFGAFPVGHAALVLLPKSFQKVASTVSAT